MKALFYLFLFANVVFFGWALMVGEPGRERVVPNLGPVIPMLHLAVESSSPTQAGAAPLTGKRCVTVGPFLQAAAVDHAEQLLRTQSLNPQRRQAEQPSPIVYRVSETQANATVAQNRLAQLTRAGVTGAQLMESPTTVTLSFGVYPTPEDAASRIQKLKNYAVKALAVEESKSATVWWLDVELAAGDRPVDVAAVQATGQAASPLQLQPCTTPESAPSAPASTPALPDSKTVAPAKPSSGPAVSPVPGAPPLPTALPKAA